VNSKPKTKSSKLPFVLVNMAMTADGKIATANRAVSSFGSARDHEHLLELRDDGRSHGRRANGGLGFHQPGAGTGQIQAIAVKKWVG